MNSGTQHAGQQVGKQRYIMRVRQIRQRETYHLVAWRATVLGGPRVFVVVQRWSIKD